MINVRLVKRHQKTPGDLPASVRTKCQSAPQLKKPRSLHTMPNAIRGTYLPKTPLPLKESKRHLWDSNPRGDPIGLAGRRLNHSAKVSFAIEIDLPQNCMHDKLDARRPRDQRIARAGARPPPRGVGTRHFPRGSGAAARPPHAAARNEWPYGSCCRGPVVSCLTSPW